MKGTVIKYVGFILALLSHPIGYNLWSKIIWIPYIYPGNGVGYTETEATILIGVGILELFLIGLSLFLVGVYLENQNKGEKK